MSNDFTKRLSESSKTQKKAKDVMDLLIPEIITSGGFIDEFRIMKDNYNLYNNIIDQEEFIELCNPLVIDFTILNEIKQYNKTYQYIDVLLGEELDRKETPRAIAVGNNSIKQKNIELREKYSAYVNQEIAKAIEKIQMSMQGASEDEIQQKMQEMTTAITPDDQYVNNFKSELENAVNKIINYAYFDCDIQSLKNEGFFHAMITDRELAWVGEENGKPTVKILNPLFTFFDKSPNVKYVQDGNYAGHVTWMTVADILAIYGDELKKQDIDQIQNRIFGTGDYYGTPSKTIETYRDKPLETRFARSRYFSQVGDEDELYGRSYTNSSYAMDAKCQVTHIEWKWLRKIGFLNITTIDGIEDLIMVDENYPIPKDAISTKYTNKFDKNVTRIEWDDEFGVYSLEWMWVPDIWEGTRIDDDKYVRVRRKPNQIYSVHNPFDVKLGYHGVKYNTTNAPSISIMGRMKPYQFLYFITMHQMGELVARNKGPIRNIDTSQIDLLLGDGDPAEALQKTIYYQEKGYNIYNALQNNQGGPTISRPQPNIQSASSSQDILNLAKMLEWLEFEIGKAAGISPQRASRFTASSNVTDNQQSIVQSALITEKYFNRHSKLWNEIISSYVTIFKKWALDRLTDEPELYIQYILPDQGVEALKIMSPDQLMGDVSIFISSTNQTYQYAQKLEQLSLSLIQNDQASIVDISNILRSRVEGVSPSEIHKMLEVSYQRKVEREQQAQQMQMEMQKRQEEFAKLVHERELEKIVIAEEERRKTQIIIAQITEENDSNRNGIQDDVEIKKELIKSETALKIAKDKNETDLKKERMKPTKK